MVAEMRWRRHGWRCVYEMSAVMVIEALGLLALSAAGVVARADLFAWYHGLMPGAMVLAMVHRLDVYTRPLTHGQHG
jgi:hypothetical protein